MKTILLLSSVAVLSAASLAATVALDAPPRDFEPPGQVEAAPVSCADCHAPVIAWTLEPVETDLVALFRAEWSERGPWVFKADKLPDHVQDGAEAPAAAVIGGEWINFGGGQSVEAKANTTFQRAFAVSASLFASGPVWVPLE